jgi:nucleoid-associated protein YgaU
MPRLTLTIIALAALLWGCAKPPRDELQAARMAVANAYAAGAAELAANDYQAAGEALSEGERFARQGNYKMAREVLPFAEVLAHRAILKAREEQTIRELQKIREQQQTAEPAREESKRPPTPPTKKAISIPAPGSKPAPVSPPPPPPPLTRYVVSAGDALWSIAARKEVYGDPLLWPIIYRANRDQIKDPRQVYPGQTLNIPRGVSAAELEEARNGARLSDIFPVNQILKNSRKNSR